MYQIHPIAENKTYFLVYATPLVRCLVSGLYRVNGTDTPTDGQTTILQDVYIPPTGIMKG